MKMLRTLFITGSVLLLLSSCGGREAPATSVTDTPPVQPKQETQPVPITPEETIIEGDQTQEECTTVNDTDGLPLLTAYITRPDVSGLVDGAAKKAIDRYYDELYRKEAEWWTGDLVNFARENKKAAEDYGSEFMPFSIAETSEIVYDGSAFVSIRRDLETYTGGAHGSHAVSCENFRKSDGSLVKLAELFREADYKNALLQLLTQTIEGMEKQQSLYDNWQELLDQTFDADRFLIGPEALTIVYQEYDIAPYALGVQTFPLSYADLSNVLIEPFLREIYGGKE